MRRINSRVERVLVAVAALAIGWTVPGCSSTCASGCLREIGEFSAEKNGFQSRSVPCDVSLDSGNTAFAIAKLRDELRAEDRRCLSAAEDSLLNFGAAVLTSSRLCLAPGLPNPPGPSAAPTYLKHLLLVSAPARIRLSLIDSLSNNYFFICDSGLTPGTYNIRYDYRRLYAMQSQPVFEKMHGSIISGVFNILMEINDAKGEVVGRQLSRIQIR